ncbi:MAG: patatin-like phospholipase family protein [Bacteroidota bacterium]
MEEYPVTQITELIPPGRKINLVLSGGGVKGVAHIALLEYLEELGVTINAISGSSAGALVGALYCSGLTPKEILAFFKTTPIFRYTWLNPIKAGIFDSEKYALVLEQKIKYRFEDLQIPLTIAATNIEKNKATYFNQGEVTPPLLASCAIPAVFSPVPIEGELYSDGGVMDNFPIRPFLNEGFPIIGSCVCKPEVQSSKDINSILKVTNHTSSLLLYAANAHKFKDTLTTIDFPLGAYGSFDTKKIKRIYQKAREYLQMETQNDESN